MGCCSQAPCQYITTSIAIMASSLNDVLFPSTLPIYHNKYLYYGQLTIWGVDPKHHDHISHIVFILWSAHLMGCCSQAPYQYITIIISIMASSLDGVLFPRTMPIYHNQYLYYGNLNQWGAVPKQHSNISQIVFILWPAHLIECCSQALCTYITTSNSIMASSLDGVLFPSTMAIYHNQYLYDGHLT